MSPGTDASHAKLARVVRQHAGQLAASLVRVTGRFATARSTGTLSGTLVGFGFTGRGDTGRGYAQFGPERNGVFLA
jgi:hypothetical protein